MMTPFWFNYCLELTRGQDGWPSTMRLAAEPECCNAEGVAFAKPAQSS